MRYHKTEISQSPANDDMAKSVFLKSLSGLQFQS